MHFSSHRGGVAKINSWIPVWCDLSVTRWMDMEISNADCNSRPSVLLLSWSVLMCQVRKYSRTGIWKIDVKYMCLVGFFVWLFYSPLESVLIFISTKKVIACVMEEKNLHCFWMQFNLTKYLGMWNKLHIFHNFWGKWNHHPWEVKRSNFLCTAVFVFSVLLGTVVST